MVLNQLNVYPIGETYDYLLALFSGSSMGIDVDSLKVEIMTSQDPIEACPDNVYRTYGANVKVWYDSNLQRSVPILTLESADLNARVLQLNEEGVVREWMDFYSPHMVLMQSMNAMHIHTRRNVLAFANALYERELVFGKEFVSQVNLLAPENADYNLAMQQEYVGRLNGPAE